MSPSIASGGARPKGAPDVVISSTCSGNHLGLGMSERYGRAELAEALGPAPAEATSAAPTISSEGSSAT